MPEERRPKSAYELAMERLEAKDRAEGVRKGRPLTPEEKEEIARLRREAKAKLAEMEILHGKHLASAGGDPAEIAKIEENYRTDRARVDDRLETQIEKILRR